MTKTLQKKFIVTAMAAISVLIAVLLGALNVAFGWTAGQQATRLLDMLSENEGEPGPEKMMPERGTPGIVNRPIDEDTAMSARYFLVRLDTDGSLVETDISHISSVTEAEAKEYANKINDGGKSEGKINHFRYKTSSARNGNGSVIVCLDTTAQTRSILTVFVISVMIGIFCWLLMLLLVALLSKKAILPIARSIEKQKQFVTDAGHEIKTPLAIILANTDAMELHNGENKWSCNIREQTLRLSGLMQNLLSLAKMEESDRKLPLEEIFLSSLLEDILSSFREPAALKEVAIKEEIQAQVLAFVNRDNTIRLFTIMFDNAVKYTDTGGQIEVQLKKQERGAVLKVKNTCSQLPVDGPEKLFDRFYRGDSARTQKSGGYGIGLSAAKAIVEAQKGSISAVYENEDTLVFTVTFFAKF